LLMKCCLFLKSFIHKTNLACRPSPAEGCYCKAILFLSLVPSFKFAQWS
jgi:hypothetical protein